MLSRPIACHLHNSPLLDSSIRSPPVLLSPPCYGSGLLPPPCKFLYIARLIALISLTRHSLVFHSAGQPANGTSAAPQSSQLLHADGHESHDACEQLSHVQCRRRGRTASLAQEQAGRLWWCLHGALEQWQYLALNQLEQQSQHRSQLATAR